MKVNYDRVADALYITLKQGKVRTTKEVSDYVLHDLDAKGNMLGIEILGASKHMLVKKLEEDIENGIPLNIVSATPVAA